MKVKMISTCAGPTGCYQPGQIYDLPAAEAESLVSGRYAIRVEAEAAPEQPQVETATAETREMAQGRGQRGRRRR